MIEIASVTGNEEYTLLNIQIQSPFNWENLKAWMIENGINPNHGYFRTSNKKINKIQWITFYS